MKILVHSTSIQLRTDVESHLKKQEIASSKRRDTGDKTIQTQVDEKSMLPHLCERYVPGTHMCPSPSRTRCMSRRAWVGLSPAAMLILTPN